MDKLIKSERLYLRPSTFEDCKLFELWESQPYIREFFSMNDWRDYKEIVTEFVIRQQDATHMQFTIVINDTDEPIGRVQLSRYDKDSDSIDITRIYIGKEEYLRKGYGYESLKVLLKFLFEEIKLERVTLDFYEDNIRAKTLYEKLNFKSEGVMRNAAKKNNAYANLHLMSILSEEYFSTK